MKATGSGYMEAEREEQVWLSQEVQVVSQVGGKDNLGPADFSITVTRATELGRGREGRGLWHLLKQRRGISGDLRGTQRPFMSRGIGPRSCLQAGQ